MSGPEDAEVNIFEKAEEYQAQLYNYEQTKFGHRNYFQTPAVPLQGDYIEKVEKGVNMMQDILRPYWMNGAHKSHKAYIGEKLFLKLNPWVNELNRCLYNSNDITDSNTCGDKFLNQVEGEGIDWAKKFARKL